MNRLTSIYQSRGFTLGLDRRIVQVPNNLVGDDTLVEIFNMAY